MKKYFYTAEWHYGSGCISHLSGIIELDYEDLDVDVIKSEIISDQGLDYAPSSITIKSLNKL